MKNSFLLLVFIFIGSIGKAQLYGLDQTFAANGLYLGDTGICARFAIQQDGKIITIGGERQNGDRTFAMRFNTDGSIDKNFGNDGYFKCQIPGFELTGLNFLHIQPDGKILLGGAITLTSIFNDDLFIIRLKINGELDSTFGNYGFVVTSLAGNEHYTSIVVQPDLKILAYGYWQEIEDRIIIVRYQPDGTIDSSFGTNGVVQSETTSWGFHYPTPNDIKIMQDGRIVIGLKASIFALNPPSGNTAFSAIRLLPNGSLDTSFNHTGIAYTNTNLPGLIYCRAMSLQPDGKILLFGDADSLAIIRFDSSGSLDNSFGINGLKKFDTLGRLEDGLIQPDGKIVAGVGIDNSMVLYRFKPNGEFDSSFGIYGRVSTASPAPNINLLLCIGLQTDGKLLAGGAYFDGGSDGKVMLARYTPNATSVNAIDLEQSISIYPNPAHSKIHIDNKTNHLIVALSLHSLDGKLFLSRAHPNIKSVNTDGLPNGIYFLKIRFDNHLSTTRKLLIQKN